MLFNVFNAASLSIIFQSRDEGSDLDDDDELQLLQLRAVALASAAQANKKFIERESKGSPFPSGQNTATTSRQQQSSRNRRGKNLLNRPTLIAKLLVLLSVGWSGSDEPRNLWPNFGFAEAILGQYFPPPQVL